MRLSKIVGLACLSIITTTAVATAAISGVHLNNVFALNRDNNGNLVCGDYETNLDWNISHEEVVENKTTPSDVTTGLVTSLVTTNFNSTESNKAANTENCGIFGTGSKKGSLTLSLNKDIDGLGLYARHGTNNSENKIIKINNQEVTLTDSIERYFIELSSATNEITIEAKNTSSNRFYVYSIGFYSTNNFPDHSSGGGEDDPTLNSITISPNDLNYTANTDLSTEVIGNVTLTFDKNTASTPCRYGLADNSIRMYAGSILTISLASGSITDVNFTCSTGSLSGDNGSASASVKTFITQLTIYYTQA